MLQDKTKAPQSAFDFPGEMLSTLMDWAAADEQTPAIIRELASRINRVQAAFTSVEL